MIKGRCQPLWLLLLLCRTLAAQPIPSQTPSDRAVAMPHSPQQLLDEYVKLAVEKSPTLSALRAKHSSARELVAPAGALPDPMVGVLYQSMGPPWQPMPPMSMVQGELSQVIPGVGKRQARRNAAEAEADLRKADIGATKARIAADVTSLFAQIYAADQEQRANESASELINVMVGAVTGQFESGRIDQEALAKVGVERNKLMEQSIDIQTNRSILVVRLNSLLTRPTSTPVPHLDALPEAVFDLSRINEDTSAASPALRIQRAAIAAAGRRKESAETETRPNFLVGVSGGATTSGEPILTLRFGMELPIWRSSKQVPLIRAARSDLDATESEYRAMELRLQSETAEFLFRLKRDSKQIQLYREAIIPNALLALQAARNAYATGRADFATVIEDFRLWLDAQVGLSRREADRLMTWAELRALTDHTN